jgi:hypothetical protein
MLPLTEPVEAPKVSILSAADRPPSRPPRRPTRLDAYLTAGAGTFLATGAGAWTVAYRKLGDARDLCNTPPGCSDSERQDRVSTIQTLKWMAAGSWAVGGGLAIAAGTHFWLSRPALGSSPTPDDVTASWKSNLRVTRTILFAAGATGLAASAGFGLRALGKKHDYENDPGCAYTCAALTDAHQAADISTGFAVAGTTLVIAGAATLLYRPAANDTRTRPARDLTVVVGDRQLVLAGSF